MSQPPIEGQFEPSAPQEPQWGPPQTGPNPNNGGSQPPQLPPVPAVLKNIPNPVWARTFLLAAVFLGGALIMAGITAAFGVTAVNLAVDFSRDFEELLPDGASWIVLTIQLLGMAFLSPLSLGIDLGGFSEIAFSGSAGHLIFVPWLILAGGVAAVMGTQRYLGGNIRVPTTGVRLMLAGLSGLAFATVVTILVSAVRFRTYIDEFGVEGRIFLHSASFGGFIVAAIVVGLITYLYLMPQYGINLQRIKAAFSTVFEHTVIIAAIAAVSLIIYVAIVADAEALLAVLFALPNLALAAFSLIHFIPIQMKMAEGSSRTGVVETLTLFDFPQIAVIIIGLVLMVLVLALVAFRWSLRTRFYAHARWSWITLPIAYFLTGILFNFANGFFLNMNLFDERLRMSISSATWGFLLWPVIAGIILVLAIYVMPRLAAYLPSGLMRVLGVGLELPPQQHAPQQPPVPVASQHSETSQPPLTEAPPPPPAPEQQWVAEDNSHLASDQGHTAYTQPTGVPEPKKMSRRAKGIMVSITGVVVLAGVLWAAHGILARTVFGPQHVAKTYLEAVVDGRAEEALDIVGPNVTDGLRVLATDEIYQAATNRPESFEIGDITRDGSTATIEASLSQGGKEYPLKLQLEKSGSQAIFFADWAVSAGDIAGRAVYVSGPNTLTINGIETEITPVGQLSRETEGYETVDITEVAAETGQVLLPGTYTFTAPEGSKYLTSGEDLELTITPGENSETPIEFNQRYNEAFAQDVVTTVRQRLESCLTNGVIRIPDCEAASWEDTIWEAMTDIQRTWESVPTIEVVPADTSEYGESGNDLTNYSGPVVARITDGKIHVDYQVRNTARQDWMDRSRVIQPFRMNSWEAMELPVTLDGDNIVIDDSPLNHFNPSWLKPESREGGNSAGRTNAGCSGEPTLPAGIDSRVCNEVVPDARALSSSSDSYQIVSPSENISCHINGGNDNPTLDCVMEEPSVSIGMDSESAAKERSYDGGASDPITLDYGKAVTAEGYVCVSQELGMSCWHTESKHGMFLSRAQQVKW